MNNRIDILLNSLLQPQSNIIRLIDTAFLLLCSITTALIYYSINYELCIHNKCNNLMITKYWVASSEIYLIFSTALFISSVFIYKSKQLSRLISLTLTIALSSGTILSGMIIFAIIRELNT